MTGAARSTALIAGASRGLGLGLAREYLARGWDVIGTVRGAGRNGLHDLAATAGDRLAIEQLDTTDEAEIRALRERLSGRTLDVLFVNAGVANGAGETVAATSADEFVRIMLTNALAPLRVIDHLLDRVAPSGVVAAMSSGLGSVGNNTAGGWEVYRASKAALNTMMRSLGARQASSGRSFIAVAPGWVRTDMGGSNAILDVETSTSGIVDMLTDQAGKPGMRYLDYQGKTVAW